MSTNAIRVARRHLRTLGATLSGNLAGEAAHSDLLVAHPSSGVLAALIAHAAGVSAAVVCTDLSTIATDGRTVNCVERAELGNLVPARPWRFIG